MLLVLQLDCLKREKQKIVEEKNCFNMEIIFDILNALMQNLRSETTIAGEF